MRTNAIVAAAAVSAALLTAGCNAHSSSISPALKASASALASIPGADAQQILINAGVPINGSSAQQLAFIKSMVTKANRDAFYNKLDIPSQNKAAFEAALLTAAKSDVMTHAGHVKFFDTDLPNIFVKYQVATP